MNVDLIAARRNRGLSQRAAALEIGVHRSTLDQAERGNDVRLPQAFKIASFYGRRVTDFWPVDTTEAAA